MLRKIFSNIIFVSFSQNIRLDKFTTTNTQKIDVKNIVPIAIYKSINTAYYWIIYQKDKFLIVKSSIV